MSTIDHKVFKSQFPKRKRFKEIGNDDLWETAYHEAGHALIDLIHGYTPKHATIIPENDTLGNIKEQFNNEYDYAFLHEKMDEDYDDSTISERIFKNRIISLLGGIIAGAYYSGRYNWKGGLSDFREVLNMFLSMGINEITIEDSAPLWAEATELIVKNEAALKKIASDLYEKKTLNQDYFKDFNLNAFLSK